MVLFLNKVLRIPRDKPFTFNISPWKSAGNFCYAEFGHFIAAFCSQFSDIWKHKEASIPFV